ncbi:RNA polymerase sigma factor [Nonomuraea muscovyensis]|uniref:RNA polymerase sigma-70 factor (ECF subfamily) n=1 Tax=Nonomuraea muscovyensis TaxID=1124761 RepID=A0A7X0EY22_9ACTN|nr:RNA polymerase sigma factor [Nonomuraea muscovyensis]MBB6348677.1 RNA polymerase sigma-70 factor (ECF subfamily) [Nonomuraea muscovyensis]
MQDPRVPSGARDRFEALYLTHYPAIYRYALRRTESPDDIADVIAETFLVAWRRLDDVPTGEATVLWLYGAARRVLANHRRGKSRRSALASRLRDELAAGRGTPSAHPRADAVHAALVTLPPAEREVLALTYWEQLTGPQIAQVLGCSSTAVRLRLHRARKRLARLLATTDEFHMTSVLRGETR